MARGSRLARHLPGPETAFCNGSLVPLQFIYIQSWININIHLIANERVLGKPIRI